ncbi:MAG TPA: M48 family metalloprotease [Casimicrobiaceae bacterium]|nr:M48 family metalloprotease [Casimicrobiaceae bacterium]
MPQWNTGPRHVGRWRPEHRHQTRPRIERVLDLVTNIPLPPQAYRELQVFANALWLLFQALCLALAFLAMRARLGTWLLARFRSLTTNKYAVAALFGATLCVTLGIVHAFLVYCYVGLANHISTNPAPSLMQFLVSRSLEILAYAAIAAALAAIAILLMTASPKKWWLWAAMAISAITFVGLYAEPYTQDLRPLGASTAEQKIRSLTARVNIPPAAVVKESCGSDDCPPGHVIGLGPSRRLVLDSALTSRLLERELLQVVAHETKHYVLDDNVKAFVAISLLSFLGLFVVDRSSNALIHRYPRALGFSSLADPRSVPLMLFAGWCLYLLTLPAISAFRTNVELEADRFGLELNRDNAAFVSVMLKDAKRDPMLIHYTPITRWFRATHPDIASRIELADIYHPWLDHRSLAYQAYFTSQDK